MAYSGIWHCFYWLLPSLRVAVGVAVQAVPHLQVPVVPVAAPAVDLAAAVVAPAAEGQHPLHLLRL